MRSEILLACRLELVEVFFKKYLQIGHVQAHFLPTLQLRLVERLLQLERFLIDVMSDLLAPRVSAINLAVRAGRNRVPHIRSSESVVDLLEPVKQSLVVTQRKLEIVVANHRDSAYLAHAVDDLLGRFTLAAEFHADVSPNHHLPLTGRDDRDGGFL